MRRRLTIVSLLAAAPFATGAMSPALAQGDMTTLCQTLATAYSAAVETGNPAKVQALFAANAVVVTPEGIIQGQQAVAKWIEGGIKPGVHEVVTARTGGMAGGMLMCSGDWQFTLAPGGPVPQIGGHYGATETKEGVISMLTTNYPPPPMLAPNKP